MKSIKKLVGIKTINKESQQNIEETNAKDAEGKKEEQIMNYNYRPIPENDKEVVIVDYKIENVPNLIDIIKGLFDKESLDISSLTRMFCCYILRKIRFSKYKTIETRLIKCVEDYIGKDNSQPLLKTYLI